MTVRELVRGRAPWLVGVRDEVVFHVKRPWRWWRRVTVPLRYWPLPDGRVWRSMLGNRLHVSLNRGAIAYRYRGMRCVRYPVDLALYLLLLQELRPLTIVEIGSKEGGAAAWYADMCEVLDIPVKVYSIDLDAPNPVYQPFNVKFLRGDENCLERVDLAWHGLPHPWLVIQDASHQYSGVLASMKFLDVFMRTGDYLVVEDGYLAEMGEDWHRDGGPARAIAEFVRFRKEWKIDGRLCDWFGVNVTANTNGWLVKQ